MYLSVYGGCILVDRDVVTVEEWIKEKVGNKQYKSDIQNLNLEDLFFPYYIESTGICTPSHYFSE